MEASCARQIRDQVKTIHLKATDAFRECGCGFRECITFARNALLVCCAVDDENSSPVANVCAVLWTMRTDAMMKTRIPNAESREKLWAEGSKDCQRLGCQTLIPRPLLGSKDAEFGMRVECHWQSLRAASHRAQIQHCVSFARWMMHSMKLTSRI